MKKNRSSLFPLSLLTLALMATSTQVQAAGYRIDFQSAAALGNAGDAALADDAATNWYNAAGLVYVPRQVIFSAFDVYVPANFTGTAIAPGLSTFSGAGGAASHPNNILPGFHAALPFNDNVAFGFSVVPAWGFSEDYGDGSLVRYSLRHIRTRSLDFEPSIAMKINDQWSVGLGPDIHYFSVASRTSARTQPVTTADSLSSFDASHVNWGGHIGVLFRYDDATRIGLNYRSRITMHLDGESEFIFGDSGTTLSTDDFRLRVPLPATTTLSLYHAVTPCWALMGTLQYDQWSVLNRYHAENLMTPLGAISSIDLPQNMHDTLDIGVGTNYKLTERLMLRGAIKYLPTPTRTAYRQVTFPDGDKLGLQVGARYQVNANVAVDALYGHVFVREVDIHDVNPATSAISEGRSKSSIDFLGGQVVWTF